MLEEIEGLITKETPARLEIFKRREHMSQVSEKYRAVLSKGLRFLEEHSMHGLLKNSGQSLHGYGLSREFKLGLIQIPKRI